MKSAVLGIVVNLGLATVKLIAGLLGNAYVLIADAAESLGDLVSSLIVIAGLRIASRAPNDQYPYGYGRAETLAAAMVSMFMIFTALGIFWVAVQEIMTPHEPPAAWTLIVLVVVIAAKWLLSRTVKSAGESIGSQSVQADAWHHLSDAITSAAAFIGIAIAVWNGAGWESADDWAAVVAATIIAVNGSVLLRRALNDLMDRKLEPERYASVRRTAESVPKVLAVEKLVLRRTGLNVFADIHVQADPSMPLSESHALGGLVKATIKAAHPEICNVLVHMEPFGDKEDWNQEG
jgi:cation diffusion facilitator family transporter